MKKLRPTLTYSFELDEDIMEDFELNLDIKDSTTKKKSNIIIHKEPKKTKFGKDASTRLF